MPVTALVASVVCILGVFGLLVAERKKRRGLRILSKSVASTAFVLVGVILVSMDSANSFSIWILSGLVFGAFGDIALLVPSSRGFLVGLGSFLIGHLAYLVACHSVVPVSAWMSITMLVPIAAAALALLYLWPHLASMNRKLSLTIS